MDYSKMTLKEKVLKTFIVTIREINKFGGPEEFFKKYPVGGMYFCEAKNIGIEGHEKSLLTTFNRLEECRKYSKDPLLVCVDYVAMAGQTYRMSPRSLGGTQREEDAYTYGKTLGMQCNSRGIDWILGPAIDMYYSKHMPFDAISADVKMNAKLFSNVVKGIQDQGVCATVKHFPGLGTDNVNMHHAPGENILEFDEWMESYGYTYKEMFKENVCSVMTTHTMLKSYDNEIHNGYLPIATYSDKLTEELLKGELGFNGAVVTDALIMGGMATGDLVAETVQAFKAGADLLLWPPMEAADAIAEKLESGEIPMSRLDDALARIDKMRAFREKALNEKHFDEPDLSYITNELKSITHSGICLYKNDMKLIPLKNDVKNILILDAMQNDEPSIHLKNELVKRGYSVDIKKDIYDTDFYVCWQDDIDELQKNYDIVILNAHPTSADGTHDPMFMLLWASHLFSKKKKIIINYGKPFVSLNYFPEDLTIIEANTNPSEAVAEFIVDGLVGEMEFSGKFILD